MANLAEDLAQAWRARLAAECPEQSAATRESIVRWLLGEDLARFEMRDQTRLEIARQAMEYRYRILQIRYLGVGSERAYRNLTTRLSSLVMLRNKISTWVALSRDRQRAVVDVLQEVIQELLQGDRYMQQQMLWIAKCTNDARLRNTLLLASTEEYCLRPIRNQPLLVYRFVNYLRRAARGGLTQIPNKDLVHLVSEEILNDNSESTVNLIDRIALAEYEDKQTREEQQGLRMAVKQEFENYIQNQLGLDAVQWLQLYLQGKSQEAIARSLNLEIKQVYRLREKVSYHAVRIFALKDQPELVSTWLETSLQDHSFGLTPQQWQKYLETLTPRQCQLIQQLKAGKTLEDFAKAKNLKTQQVMGEWSKLCLAAQALRSA